MNSPRQARFKLDRAHKKVDDETTWLLIDKNVPPYVSNEGALSSCCSYLGDPNCRPYRYTIAILVAIIEGILAYCYEYPASLQSNMIKVMNLDNTQYDTLISSNTWPDIVMSILGTVFIDKFIGMRKGLVIFTTLILIGQSIVSAGAYMNAFEIMLFGRLLLGCGLGTACGLASAYMITWFGGKEINFICAVSRCFHRLSASLALFLPRLVYEALDGYVASSTDKHGTAHMTCTFLCLIAVIMSVIAGLLDLRGAKITGRKPMRKNVSISGILTFPPSFWILIIISSLHYGLIAAITGNAPLFFISKYDMTTITANFANSLSYMAVILITPFIGILIDITGYNLLWGMLGLYFALASNLIYVISSNVDWYAPYLAALLYSIAFTFFGSGLWIAPGFLVSNHQVTTAFGVLMSLISISITTMSLTAGVVIDHLGYLILGILFVIIVFIAILLSILLAVYEVTTGVRILTLSGKSRRNAIKK